MRHDAHYWWYRIHCAKQYLGTRHVLHAEHSGDVSHNPSEVNVARTIKRAQRKHLADWNAAIAEDAFRKMVPNNVSALTIRKGSK